MRPLNPVLAAALVAGTFVLHLPAWQQAPVTAPATSQPPAAAERLTVPGLPNLGRVSPNLYRGAQPKAAGYDQLQRLGVGIVVDFNTGRQHIARESAAVEARGMRYLSIPWSASARPSDAQVAEFFRLLRENDGRKIFVHCKHGADRTGTMIALYRISEESWTPQQALDEMEAFHFHGFLYRHLKRYVREFPARAASQPLLTARPAPAQD